MKFSNLNLLLTLTRFSKRNWIILGKTFATRAQSRLYKKINFVILYIGKANVELMENCVMFAIKRTILMFAVVKPIKFCVGKKVHEMEKGESDESPTRAIEFFIQTINI